MSLASADSLTITQEYKNSELRPEKDLSRVDEMKSPVSRMERGVTSSALVTDETTTQSTTPNVTEQYDSELGASAPPTKDSPQTVRSESEFDYMSAGLTSDSSDHWFIGYSRFVLRNNHTGFANTGIAAYQNWPTNQHSETPFLAGHSNSLLSSISNTNRLLKSARQHRLGDFSSIDPSLVDSLALELQLEVPKSALHQPENFAQQESSYWNLRNVGFRVVTDMLRPQRGLVNGKDAKKVDRVKLPPPLPKGHPKPGQKPIWKESFTDVIKTNVQKTLELRNRSSDPLAALFVYKKLVNLGGDWDYKQQQPKDKGAGDKAYQYFGNFHYGATAAALGLSLESAQRMAGWAQMRNVRAWKAEFGTFRGGWPYGDDPFDQLAVEDGYIYFHQNHKKLLDKPKIPPARPEKWDFRPTAGIMYMNMP